MAVQGISGGTQQIPVPTSGQSAPVRPPAPPVQTPSSLAFPTDTVTLTPDARNASSRGAIGGVAEGGGSISEGNASTAPQECQTCRNRKYVDRSNDATVSFQSPTRVAPGGAETAVRAHEQEHVSNEQQKAEEEGRKVVSQTVSIQYGICTECGRSYVAGGTTTTVTRAESQPGAFLDGLSPAGPPGGSVDLKV